MPPNMNKRVEALEGSVGVLRVSMEEFQKMMMAEFDKLRDRRIPDPSYSS